MVLFFNGKRVSKMFLFRSYFKFELFASLSAHVMSKVIIDIMYLTLCASW